MPINIANAPTNFIPQFVKALDSKGIYHSVNKMEGRTGTFVAGLSANTTLELIKTFSEAVAFVKTHDKPKWSKVLKLYVKGEASNVVIKEAGDGCFVYID